MCQPAIVLLKTLLLRGGSCAVGAVRALGSVGDAQLEVAAAAAVAIDDGNHDRSDGNGARVTWDCSVPLASSLQAISLPRHPL